ncbi:hypothetical protein INR49_010043 [Caranx melampygus]|nr:hypothetical protein INR49_010043 [Caranx melampygus]
MAPAIFRLSFSSVARCRMSSAAEDEEAAALETVKSVTLTQDSDGSIILHCPPTDGDSEPLQKKLRLSTEQQDESETPQFSVVTLPMSESDDGFEVTMTATADGDLSEEGVAQIQWKQGMWSKEEIDILMSNIERYVKERGIEDPAEIIFEMSKEERKDFYRSVALGLNRPLFAVYRRVLRMYDNRNHVGKYTPDEIEKLKSLREKHGNDWATIGAALGRSVSPGSAVTGGVSWASVADCVRTRSEKQCRSKWLNYLNWKHSGGTEWMKEDDLNLIRRISELEVEDENEIKWEDLAGGWSSVRSPQWLRSKWWSIKRQIRLTRLEESSGGSPAPSSMAALQIPVQIPLQITHLASEASAAADTETITLNTGALQTFEILPSFHLQPTGTPGTYYLQTTSNQSLPLSLSTSQGLPLSLTNNSTVTLTTGSSPSSHEHIILHSLSLVVETEGRNQDDHLDASSLLESSESVVTETQEPMTDGFTDKIRSWRTRTAPTEQDFYCGE